MIPLQLLSWLKASATEQNIKALGLLVVLLAWLGTIVLSYDKGVEIEKLRLENKTLADNLAASEAYLLDMQNSKKQADIMYAELKSKYTELEKKLLANNQTIRTLQRTPGTADYDLLNRKLTPKVISIANGVDDPAGMR